MVEASSLSPLKLSLPELEPPAVALASSARLLARGVLLLPEPGVALLEREHCRMSSEGV